MSIAILHGDARNLPFPDDSIDLIVTSPPYFGLRSYTDGGRHYDTQIGAEATPQEFIAALVACTREMARVLKPSGSIFVNLGDKYAQNTERSRNGLGGEGLDGGKPLRDADDTVTSTTRSNGVRTKSLLLLPERYRIACIDELGLIARAVIVWAKPNGLPESVRDRVRRSHEDWVHLTKSPRYFESVDEIREPASDSNASRARAIATADRSLAVKGTEYGGRPGETPLRGIPGVGTAFVGNPLGKLPGSVWSIATQPLKVPAELNVDHFAAFPMEWPRRLITGWCPREVCTGCGEGRRPVVERPTSGGDFMSDRSEVKKAGRSADGPERNRRYKERVALGLHSTITGYACACPDTSAPSTPGVVLDPFGGTGTTALVADVLGRVGISLDASSDYCRLARWRTTDERERAAAAGNDRAAVVPVTDAAPGLFDLIEDAQ